MTSILAAILAIAVSGPVEQTPVQELGGVMVGRWIGDVTLIADWPGLGNRGDKVVAYVTVDWIADGEAFEIEWFGGIGTSKEIFGWDAAEKKVRSLGVSSGGTTWRTVWTKNGDHWSGKSKESLADGTRVAGSQITLAPQESGKKLVFTNEGEGFVGDTKMDPLHDVYTRLNPEDAGNTPLQEYGDLTVGRWIGDIGLVRDWPGIGKKGDRIVEHVSAKWTADRRALVREWRGGQGCGYSIFVWDPTENKIKQCEVSSGGACFTAWIWKEGDTWKWTLAGQLGDGTTEEGSGTIAFRDGHKKCNIAGDLVVGGEKVSFVDPYTRLGK
jgi:hypothetical protein